MFIFDNIRYDHSGLFTILKIIGNTIFGNTSHENKDIRKFKIV